MMKTNIGVNLDQVTMKSVPSSAPHNTGKYKRTVSNFKNKVVEIFRLKMKFALSSSVATLADYLLYLFLVHRTDDPVTSNLISAGVGMGINFLLQKRYVFQLERKVYNALFISIATSLVGIALSTGIVYSLSQMEFFDQNQYITKAVATGMVFFYNFYMKRFAFEKKFI